MQKMSPGKSDGKLQGPKFMRYFTLAPNTNSLQPHSFRYELPDFFAHRKMINSNMPFNSIIAEDHPSFEMCFLSLGKVFRHPGFTFHPPPEVHLHPILRAFQPGSWKLMVPRHLANPRRCGVAGCGCGCCF